MVLIFFPSLPTPLLSHLCWPCTENRYQSSALSVPLPLCSQLPALLPAPSPQPSPAHWHCPLLEFSVVTLLPASVICHHSSAEQVTKIPAQAYYLLQGLRSQESQAWGLCGLLLSFPVHHWEVGWLPDPHLMTPSMQMTVILCA